MGLGCTVVSGTLASVCLDPQNQRMQVQPIADRRSLATASREPPWVHQPS